MRRHTDPSNIIPCPIPTGKHFKNRSGLKFGRLTALEFYGARTSRGKVRYFWKCVCECGVTLVVDGASLGNGSTRSCGCLHSEMSSKACIKRLTTHGARNTPEYKVWKGMFTRCYNPNEKVFRHYGAIGITVFAGWHGGAGFVRWRDYMGPRPSPLHEIDRINNDGHYEPGNVRWATRKQQCRNYSRNVFLEHDGLRLCLVEWSERTGLKQQTIRARVFRYGWSIEKALTTPLRKTIHAVQMCFSQLPPKSDVSTETPSSA